MNTPRRVLALIAAAALTAGIAPSAFGSSHREAPYTATDPTADNTDVYAFVTPGHPDTVTLIANFVPVQEPAGGPNFYNFDPRVLYRIHVDNDGDGRDDVTFSLQFKDRIRNKETFLYNTGPITSLDDTDFNYRQSYTLTWTRDGSKHVVSDLWTPPANIGPRSTPDYEALAGMGVYDVGGGITAFAGQRDDPFFVDTGSIFDLLGLRPFNPAHLLPRDAAGGVDGLSGFNVNTIALRVPITKLTSDGKTHAADERAATIGVWASASRQQVRILSSKGTQRDAGRFIQVSRLGNPLINEVLIPLGKKDFWNRSHPRYDHQFAKYTSAPEPARLINLLYPTLPDIDETGRADLEAILLTGVPGLNFTGPRKMDMLRLNTGIAPCTADAADDDAGTCQRLGVLAGDLAGFPNGRRLTDDVVDIEIRAIAQGYGTFLAGAFGLPNKSPNNQLGDGVDENDQAFLDAFPYVATPDDGYDHRHSHHEVL